MKVEYFKSIAPNNYCWDYTTKKWSLNKGVNPSLLSSYNAYIIIKVSINNDDLYYFTLYSRNYPLKTYIKGEPSAERWQGDIDIGKLIKIETPVNLDMLLSNDMLTRKMAKDSLHKSFKNQIKNVNKKGNKSSCED